MAEKRSRWLLLMRHAKSAYPDGVDDPNRPLAGRGRRDAKAAAGWLAERKQQPQLVFCSQALRARQTWQLAGQGVGRNPTVRFSPVVYGADWHELVSLLRTTPGWMDVVLLIGHQPTMATTVLKLAAGGSDPAALRQVKSKFPTSAIATLAVPGPWSNLSGGGAVLRRFDVPRG